MLKRWKKWEAIPENREAFDAVGRVWHVAEEIPELSLVGKRSHMMGREK